MAWKPPDSDAVIEKSPEEGAWTPPDTPVSSLEISDVPKAESFFQGFGASLPGVGSLRKEDTTYAKDWPLVGPLFEGKEDFVPLADRNVATRAFSHLPEVVSNLFTGERPIVPEPDTIDIPEYKIPPSSDPEVIEMREKMKKAEEANPKTFKSGELTEDALEILMTMGGMSAASSSKSGLPYVDDIITAAQKGADITTRQANGIKFITQAANKAKDVNQFADEAAGIINKYLLPEGAKAVTPDKIIGMGSNLKGALSLISKPLGMGGNVAKGAAVGGTTAGGWNAVKALMTGDDPLEKGVEGFKRGATAGALSPNSAMKNAALLELLIGTLGGQKGAAPTDVTGGTY